MLLSPCDYRSAVEATRSTLVRQNLTSEPAHFFDLDAITDAIYHRSEDGRYVLDPDPDLFWDQVYAHAYPLLEVGFIDIDTGTHALTFTGTEGARKSLGSLELPADMLDYGHAAVSAFIGPLGWEIVARVGVLPTTFTIRHVV